ncbi:MAG: YtxH domain-containing protein [Chloroflexi bacterium]|nr:YtxH domain-containing protein [Chloroflexota bacterium]
MSDDNDFGAFLAGFVLGGLVGAAVSLLLAPQSGAETRAVIRDKSIELKDKASVAADDVRHRADEFAVHTKERAVELQKRGVETFEEQKVRLNTAVESAKKAVRRKQVPLEEQEAEQAPGEASA